jgi:hypothetical protein
VKANQRVLMVRILPDASNHLCAQIMERVAREVPGSKRLH